MAGLIPALKSEKSLSPPIPVGGGHWINNTLTSSNTAKVMVTNGQLRKEDTIANYVKEKCKHYTTCL